METCPDCGSEMTEHEAPVWSFALWRFEIYLWGKVPACDYCASERSREPEGRAYDAGLEDGWTQAVEHHARWGL